jgi:hypothetical protein
VPPARTSLTVTGVLRCRSARRCREHWPGQRTAARRASFSVSAAATGGNAGADGHATATAGRLWRRFRRRQRATADSNPLGNGGGNGARTPAAAGGVPRRPATAGYRRPVPNGGAGVASTVPGHADVLRRRRRRRTGNDVTVGTGALARLPAATAALVAATGYSPIAGAANSGSGGGAGDMMGQRPARPALAAVCHLRYTTGTARRRRGGTDHDRWRIHGPDTFTVVRHVHGHGARSVAPAAAVAPGTSAAAAAAPTDSRTKTGGGGGGSSYTDRRRARRTIAGSGATAREQHGHRLRRSPAGAGSTTAAGNPGRVVITYTP